MKNMIPPTQKKYRHWALNDNWALGLNFECPDTGHSVAWALSRWALSRPTTQTLIVKVQVCHFLRFHSALKLTVINFRNAGEANRTTIYHFDFFGK